jgi:hypothetical protein
MDDASLEEFADAGDDAATGGEDTDADGVEPTDDSTDGTAVDPATSTYAWSSGDVACAVCGTAVTRRWRDGDDLVCPDCKEW